MPSAEDVLGVLEEAKYFRNIYIRVVPCTALDPTVG